MGKYQLPNAVAAAQLCNIFVCLVQGDWFYCLDNSVTSGSCKLASLLIEKTQQQNWNRIGVKTK